MSNNLSVVMVDAMLLNVYIMIEFTSDKITIDMTHLETLDLCCNHCLFVIIRKALTLDISFNYLI